MYQSNREMIRKLTLEKQRGDPLEPWRTLSVHVVPLSIGYMAVVGLVRVFGIPAVGEGDLSISAYLYLPSKPY